MDISAPAISLADRPHVGPFGSPVFACAGKTEPPSRRQSVHWTETTIELSGVRESGMSGRNEQRKPGTTPGVAEALPHSEGIAYKPLCGEIVMCLRVGRMGSIK